MKFNGECTKLVFPEWLVKATLQNEYLQSVKDTVQTQYTVCLTWIRIVIVQYYYNDPDCRGAMEIEIISLYPCNIGDKNSLKSVSDA